MFAVWYSIFRFANSASSALAFVLGLEQRLDAKRAPRSWPTLVMSKLSTLPCSRGSNVTADIMASVVLSRARAARKNCVRNCCSAAASTRRRAAAAAASERSVDAGSRTRHLGLLACCDTRRERRARYVWRGSSTAVAALRPSRSSSFSTSGDRDDLVLAVEIDQPHALRGAADGADVVGRRPQDLALLA